MLHGGLSSELTFEILYLDEGSFQGVIDYVTGLPLEDDPEVWMSHVTCMSESCHICMGRVTCMIESSDKRLRLVANHVTYKGVVEYVIGLLLGNDPGVRMSQVTCMNASCHMNESCHIYE